MGTVVVSHIDEFLGLGSAAESSFADSGRLSDEGYDGAVGSYARIDIEDLYAFDSGNGGDNVVNHGFIASLTVVGDALDDLFHIDRFMRCLV